MSEMQIGPRPASRKGMKTDYVPRPSYREYVFNGGRGGGKVMAHGLNEEGQVRAIVYAPHPRADREIAETLAEETLMAGVESVSRVRFAPFNLLGAP